MATIPECAVRPATITEILPGRGRYREEMDCQIIHDSLHARKGWTIPYLLWSAGSAAGYGSVAVGGPWQGNPTIFEFYVEPAFRAFSADLFRALLATSGAAQIEAQSNDPFLTPMLHAFARSATSASILFRDQAITALPANGALFRRATEADDARMPRQAVEPIGDWVLEAENRIVATGGLLFHYNRPYGDIYLEVAETFRRRGYGSYLVQELKRVCYEQGSVPTARCRTGNAASRKTLEKAGFVPCGHLLVGTELQTGSGA